MNRTCLYNSKYLPQLYFTIFVLLDKRKESLKYPVINGSLFSRLSFFFFYFLSFFFPLALQICKKKIKRKVKELLNVKFFSDVTVATQHVFGSSS